MFSRPKNSPSKDGEMRTKGIYGLEVCHDGGDAAVADVVFVHGLTGNRESTWTSKADNVFWPKDLLVKDLPHTRIMTYGYDADIAHFWAMASQNRIGEHAGNLVNAVAQKRERTDTEGRPIIFVTHSLGGLVTEDALLFSKNSAETHLQDVVRSVVGICFLGTPHCGADLARWGSVLGSLVNVVKKANVDLVNVLKTDSEVLARVQREFHTMLRSPSNQGKPPLNITCFFEELPVTGAGEIVPKHSAILASYNAIGIHANHMDMTKFGDADDLGYLAVSGELRRWVKAISKQQENLGRVPNVPNDSAQSYGRPAYPRGPELNTYGGWQGSEAGAEQWRSAEGGPNTHGGYPLGDQRMQPPHFDDDSRGYQPYPGDVQRFAGPNAESRQYSQYSSPLPPPDYPKYQGYGANPGGHRPRYEQYRSEGYSRPPPPPEPRYMEDAASEESHSPPMQRPERIDRPAGKTSHSQQETRFHQGNHVINSINSQTYGNGKTIQGNNMSAGGDATWSF